MPSPWYQQQATACCLVLWMLESRSSSMWRCLVSVCSFVICWVNISSICDAYWGSAHWCGIDIPMCGTQYHQWTSHTKQLQPGAINTCWKDYLKKNILEILWWCFKRKSSGQPVKQTCKLVAIFAQLIYCTLAPCQENLGLCQAKCHLAS